MRVGATDADAAAKQNRAFARDYMAGTFDPHAYHRFTAGLLAPHARELLERWRAAFRSEMQVRAERELAASFELVAGHRSRGDLCCIVTTTNRFVAQVFADIFGIDNLVAKNEYGRQVVQRSKGGVAGLLGTVAKVAIWLIGLSLAFRAFGTNPVTDYVAAVVGFIPRIITAVTRSVT